MMTDITQYTAKRRVRQITKSAGYIRQQLKSLHDVKGGDDERDKLHTKFCDQVQEAEHAITATDAMARDFESAGLILKTKTQDARATGLAKLASLLVRLDGTDDGLTVLTEHAASRARAATDIATGKLDKSWHDIEATRAFGAYLKALSAHGPKHGRTARAKRTYDAHRQLARR